MEKIKKTAGHLDTFFKILHTCTGIAAITAAVGMGLILAALLLGIDPDRIGTGYASISIGFLALEIAPEYAPAQQTVLIQAAVLLGFGFALSLVCRRFVAVLRRILAPMTQGEPFRAEAGKNLSDLAKLSIVIGIVANAAMLTFQAMTVFALGLPQLLVSEKITHVTGNFTADLSFLAFSAVLFLLSYVFRYGEELQQLSDETL